MNNFSILKSPELSFPSSENRDLFYNTQEEINNFCTINKKNTESLLRAQELGEKQKMEAFTLKENMNKNISNETKESLEKDILINEVRVLLYEKLGINSNQEKNGVVNNFVKGIVDELIIGNYDLALQVWNTNGKIILDMLKQLVSLEGLKALLQGIGESIWDLVIGDAYEKGKSVAELGLIVVGVGGVYQGVKFGIKSMVKGRIDKKNIVKEKEVKENIKKTQNEIEDIIPKQIMDVEGGFIHDTLKTINKDKFHHLRGLGGEGYFYSELKQVSYQLGLKEWLTPKHYIDAGEHGAIFGKKGMQIDGTNMVVKIPGKFDVIAFPQGFRKELSDHHTFYSVYQEWNSKVKKEMGYKGNIAIKIPKVKNLNGHYLMEDLTDYISLKRVLQKEFIKQEFSGKIRFDVDSLSTHELYTLSKELGVEFANDYMKARFPIMDLKDFELIKNFLGYANESGLFHKDIQVGNIMVPKNMSRPLKSVYIIDFGRVVQGGMNPFLKNRENISVKTVANRIQTSEYAYSDVLNFDYLKKNLVK